MFAVDCVECIHLKNPKGERGRDRVRERESKRDLFVPLVSIMSKIYE